MTRHTRPARSTSRSLSENERACRKKPLRSKEQAIEASSNASRPLRNRVVVMRPCSRRRACRIASGRLGSAPHARIPDTARRAAPQDRRPEPQGWVGQDRRSRPTWPRITPGRGRGSRSWTTIRRARACAGCKQRPADLPPSTASRRYEKKLGVTRAFALRTPPGTETSDRRHAGGGARRCSCPRLTRMPRIVVPVLPSDIDIHAASRASPTCCWPGRCIAPSGGWSSSPTVPAATPRPSDADAVPGEPAHPGGRGAARFAGLRAVSRTGMGIHEMKGALLQEDLDTWKPFVDWLEQRSGCGAARCRAAAQACRRDRRAVGGPATRTLRG